MDRNSKLKDGSDFNLIFLVQKKRKKMDLLRKLYML